MKRYLDSDIATALRGKDSKRGLFDELYGKGQLRLDYDSGMTRNAAQAFDAKSGNCLSLAILTAAFARELDLTVRYQTIHVEEAWSRSEGINIVAEHVNVTLGARPAVGRGRHIDGGEMTIDFLPPQELSGRRARVIGEDTIVAMYMNNRAAESLVQAQIERAYWWARAAIVQDPHFLSAYNTLGVIYLRHGNPREAEQVYRQVLAIEPGNTIAMSNLVLALNALGRTAEASELAEKLRKIQPHPPFHFFDLGVAAMGEGRFAAAKSLFAQEIQRDAYYDKFHFWLALAHYKLGDLKNAREQLALAAETSTTRSDHDLYAAKLARLGSASPR